MTTVDLSLIHTVTVREHFSIALQSAARNQDVALRDITSTYLVNLLTDYCETSALAAVTDANQQIKPLATPFDGTGLVTSTAVDTGTTGYTFNKIVLGLTAATSYHYRVRVLYDPIETPLIHHSRWIAPLRTALRAWRTKEGDEAAMVRLGLLDALHGLGARIPAAELLPWLDDPLCGTTAFVLSVIRGERKLHTRALSARDRDR